MAEKEERILHIVQKLDGRFVGENRITRTEAINRMAKALYRCMYGDTDYKTTNFEEMYIERAEHALNALLEGDK